MKRYNPSAYERGSKLKHSFTMRPILLTLYRFYVRNIFLTYLPKKNIFLTWPYSLWQIMREGDPVQKMIFIVHGRIKRSQTLSKGTLAATTLQPGTILGDELLSWCLRRPFIDRLPASNATFKCLQPTEAFSLEFDDLRYITDHFRYRFANEKVKRTARYYSSNWRNWAAVNIQFAWRRYRTGIIRVPVSSETENGGGEIRLRRYAAVFMSIRPHDHLE